jgi:transcriptional regulator with XRE-family HTH domain
MKFNITVEAISERIGMHKSLLAQYISGIKKPSAIQLSRIQNGIREIGQELCNISLLIK